uniref:Uncharacterized protein n=1 Tax=Oryza sativa subsp. japonica TaxID=39947 RepID=Q7XHM0_ORYSJ|nr:hypothetical protein [Oryza sativa Japonica Group]
MLCHLNCHPHDDEQPTRLRSSDGIAYSSEIFVFWVELESLDIHSHHRNISFLSNMRPELLPPSMADKGQGNIPMTNRIVTDGLKRPLCPIPAISLAARATSQEGDAPAPPSPRGHARRNKWGSRPQQLPSLSRRRAQSGIAPRPEQLCRRLAGLGAVVPPAVLQLARPPGYLLLAQVRTFGSNSGAVDPIHVSSSWADGAQ